MLKDQAHLFSLDEGVSYLNCAYMSPLMKSVAEAGHIGLDRKLKPWKIYPEDFFSGFREVKSLYSELINANDPERIELIPSVSYGMAVVANNIDFHAGDEIVLLGEQFPSNVYIWQRLAAEKNLKINFIQAPDGQNKRGEIWNQRILESIKPATKLVSMGHVHWADGTRFDLESIRSRTNEVDAYLVIDGTQSIGALPFDVQKIKPDALVVAAYKWLLGPYSSGLAYLGPRFDHGKPIEENWIARKDSENFSTLVNYREEYQPKAFRYGVGERSNFVVLPMIAEALRQILSWTPAAIQDYCQGISEEALQFLLNMGYWVEDPEYRGNHLLGLRLPESRNMEEVRKNLVLNDIFVSVRGNAIRVAPHLYNSKEDFDKLVDSLS